MSSHPPLHSIHPILPPLSRQRFPRPPRGTFCCCCCRRLLLQRHCLSNAEVYLCRFECSPGDVISRPVVPEGGLAPRGLPAHARWSPRRTAALFARSRRREEAEHRKEGMSRAKEEEDEEEGRGEARQGCARPGQRRATDPLH